MVISKLQVYSVVAGTSNYKHSEGSYLVWGWLKVFVNIILSKLVYGLGI